MLIILFVMFNIFFWFCKKKIRCNMYLEKCKVIDSKIWIYYIIISFFILIICNIKILDVWIELLLFVIVGIMDC